MSGVDLSSAPLDRFGLLEAAAGTGDQVARSADAARRLLADPDQLLVDHDDIEHVVVLGAGTGGLVGDLAVAVAGPFMAVPVVVHKGYALPNFVDRHTLVVSVSYSGQTEETLDATALAVDAGAAWVAVTGGGELAALADEHGAPCFGLPDEIGAARAALGALATPPLVLFEHLGLFPGATAWIDAAIDQLRRRATQLIAADNPAEHLARRIGRQMPIIYGGGGVGAVAARRWKTQFNLNAKMPAFCNDLPEIGHHEVAGWGQNGDVTRQLFQVVNLRHEFEHPQIARRFALGDELLGEVVAGIHEVGAEGEGALAQLLDLILFGDFVSLYRARQEGLDPGPVPAVDDLEARLAM